MKTIIGYKVIAPFCGRVYGKFYIKDYQTIIACFNAAKRLSRHNVSMLVTKMYN